MTKRKQAWAQAQRDPVFKRESAAHSYALAIAEDFSSYMQMHRLTYGEIAKLLGKPAAWVKGFFAAPEKASVYKVGLIGAAISELITDCPEKMEPVHTLSHCCCHGACNDDV